MSNILEFPIERTLKNRLDVASSQLEEYYDALGRMEMLAYTLEEQALEVEEGYKHLLNRYIKIVGLENTEARYLEYGVVTVYSDEEGNFTLEAPLNPND